MIPFCVVRETRNISSHDMKGARGLQALIGRQLNGGVTGTQGLIIRDENKMAAPVDVPGVLAIILTPLGEGFE